MRKNLIVLILLIWVTTCGFRIVRPDTFVLPWDNDKIEKLNLFLEDIFNLQQGEYNFDVVTTPKTRADNGDFWFVYTSPTVFIQYEAEDHTYTVTPDGYGDRDAEDILPIETTTPVTVTGQFWLIQTGQVIRLQYDGGSHNFTITPDGF